MERLAKHPDVGGYGEILLRQVEGWSNWPPGAADRPFYSTYLKDRNVDSSRMAKHRMLFEYLDYIYEPRREVRAIGFKLMYDQLVRSPEILLYLRRRRVRVLHLVRANTLDIFLSREAMTARRFVHAMTADELESVKVVVDTRRLPAALQRLEWERTLARAVLRVAGLQAHEFTYEKLLADDSGLLAVLGFLGLDVPAGLDLHAVMLKLAPPLHRSGIANYDEVRAALSGTRYAALLHE
jgi:hypothetical protein